MLGYIARAVLKEFRSSRALFLLAIAGVGLGVASVVSIQLLNESALGAFSGTLHAISGEADVSILPVSGSLDETLFPEVLSVAGVDSAIPLWRAPVALVHRPPGSNEGLELVGADLFAPVRVPWRLSGKGVADAVFERGWVALTPELASKHGWKVGDPITVSLGSKRATLVVGALIDFGRFSPLASERLAVMDIAQAQGLLGIRGRIHEIDVVARKGVTAAELATRLEERLKNRARVVTPEARRIETEGLLSAFRMNLTALSLVSVLVGAFLVYASVRASLSTRREELGVLRAVGATRGQVLTLVLVTAALLGTAGTALGLPAGWLAARANLSSVSGTLRNVYLLEGMERIAIRPWLFLLALFAGMIGAVAGSIAPALDAIREDPRALLAPITREEESVSRMSYRLTAAALSLLLAIAFQALFGRSWAPSGFVLALGVLAAVPLVSPWALVALARLGRLSRLGVRYGVFTLGRRPSAASVATSALAISVAMLAGITVMVGSFRETVSGWLDRTLRADIYVTTPSWRLARSEATLDGEVVARLREVPGLLAIDFLRQVQVRGPLGRLTVSGLDATLPGERAAARVELISGDAGRAFLALQDPGTALVSEPLARKLGLHAGGALHIETERGTTAFRVVGVYRDYGNESGAALVDLSTFARTFGEGPPSNAALHLAPGVDVDSTLGRLRRELADHSVVMRSNLSLRKEVLSVFDETFAVTKLLEAMGLVIAAAGVALSLLVLANEHRSELALYRAIGAGRLQIFRVFLGRGLAIGLVGLVVGALGGGGLALVLVLVVNPAFFGWTLCIHPPWLVLLAQALTILATAALASLFPALSASRTPAAELSRDAL